MAHAKALDLCPLRLLNLSDVFLTGEDENGRPKQECNSSNRAQLSGHVWLVIPCAAARSGSQRGPKPYVGGVHYPALR